MTEKPKLSLNVINPGVEARKEKGLVNWDVGRASATNAFY